MSSNHFITSAQERTSQQRFLALCLEAIRQTGQCSYPPLLRLIELSEKNVSMESVPPKQSYPEGLKQQVTASHQTIVTAVQTLQAQPTWNSSSEIEQAIQVIAQETKALEMLLQPIYPAGSQGASVLSRLNYLREYLFKKLTDTHFLSPQGLRAEQPMVFLQQHQRVYRYLSQLQSVTQELIEML